MTIRPFPDAAPHASDIRLEPLAGDPAISAVHRTQRNRVEPGTVVLMAFRVDACHETPDGSLLASVSRVDTAGQTTGLTERRVTLSPHNAWTVDDPRDLTLLSTGAPA